jgi:hypothetical protein
LKVDLEPRPEQRRALGAGETNLVARGLREAVPGAADQ